MASKLASPVRRDLIRTGKYGNRAEGAGGTKASATHLGIDLRAAIGTPVYTPITGTVVQIRRRFPNLDSEGSSIFSARMAGNLVVIRGWLGKVEADVNLAHLDSVAAALAVGQKVVAGATWLGASGRSGVIEPHVHLGVFRLVRNASGRVVDWIPMDPTPLLPWDGDKFGEQLATSNDSAAAGQEEDTLSDTNTERILAAIAGVGMQVGGSAKNERSLTDIARSTEAEAIAARAAAEWSKARVGGSNKSGPSVTDLLRGIATREPKVIIDGLLELPGELAEQVLDGLADALTTRAAQRS